MSSFHDLVTLTCIISQQIKVLLCTICSGSPDFVSLVAESEFCIKSPKTAGPDNGIAFSIVTNACKQLLTSVTFDLLTFTVTRSRLQILIAFSIVTNTRKLLSTSTGSGQLTSINGMRVLSMWWVILGHTFVFATTFLGMHRSFVSLCERHYRWKEDDKVMHQKRQKIDIYINTANLHVYHQVYQV